MTIFRRLDFELTLDFRLGLPGLLLRLRLEVAEAAADGVGAPDEPPPDVLDGTLDLLLDFLWRLLFSASDSVSSYLGVGLEALELCRTTSLSLTTFSSVEAAAFLTIENRNKKMKIIM